MSNKRTRKSQLALEQEPFTQPTQRHQSFAAESVSEEQIRAIITASQQETVTAFTALVQTTVDSALSRINRSEEIKDLPEDLLNTVQDMAKNLAETDKGKRAYGV